MALDRESVLRNVIARVEDAATTVDLTAIHPSNATAMFPDGITLRENRLLTQYKNTLRQLGDMALNYASRLETLDIPLLKPELPSDPELRRVVQRIERLPVEQPVQAADIGVDSGTLELYGAGINNYLRQIDDSVYFVRVPEELGVPKDTFAVARVVNEDSRQ